tara:strand:+ start:1147 stop:2730 length:1584 start_codon:yes stop_codon:yes gene_type:complete
MSNITLKDIFEMLNIIHICKIRKYIGNDENNSVNMLENRLHNYIRKLCSSQHSNIKLICAVIASKGGVYDQYKQLWLELIEKTRIKNIKFVFLYNESDSIRIDGNDMYFPYHKEVLVPGAYIKTMMFYKYIIQNNIDFTHVLRCNLSSFFVFDKLVNDLETLPLNNLVYGNNVDNKFPTGCGTVFSKDIIHNIVAHEQLITPQIYNEYIEDQCFGKILKYIDIPILNYDYVDFNPIDSNDINTLINKQHFHYRTKRDKTNEGPEIFKQLLNKWYKEPKIVDCFIFYNEIKLLEFRLQELYESVDFFVIVESIHTFTGNQKQLYFQENKHLYNKYMDKIIHIVVDDMPNTNDPWDNERFQRNCIDKGIMKLDLDVNDKIIISDVDEIFDKDTIKSLYVNDIYSLEQDMYYYNFNCRADVKWKRPKILNYGLYTQIRNCDKIRMLECKAVKRGGWHLSYFGDVEFIKNKIKNFSHQELNTSNVIDNESIQNHIDNSTDLFFRDNETTHKFRKTKIKDIKYLPKNYKFLL